MKRLVLVLLCVSSTLLNVTAFAQKVAPPTTTGPGQSVRRAEADPPAAKPSATFIRLHDATRAKFEQIQSLLSGIETGKVLREGDTQKLDKLMFDYANELKAAFDQASKDADEASQSKGQRGSAQSVATFEAMAQQHEQGSRSF